MTARFRLAVHKFSSCDGCQLALLNLGTDLLALGDQVDLVHFAEAGQLAEDEPVDLALVEGSLSARADIARIEKIRSHSRYLVTIGACATSGGLQALRNISGGERWVAAIYPSPEHLDTLERVLPIAEKVHVDWELWGCPVNSAQVLGLIRDLRFGAVPGRRTQPLCMECKRKQVICTLVTRGEPCMGPVTRDGCGVLCPDMGRACYACYGPSEQVNAAALNRCFGRLGLSREETVRRLAFINGNDPAYRHAREKLRGGE